MTSRSQLLGLAFAAADLLVEFDRDGMITLALGSSPCGTKPAEALVGKPVFERLDVGGQAELRRALAGLQPGHRSDPLHVTLLCEGNLSRRLMMRLFRLPEDDSGISCAVIYEGPVTPYEALPPSMLSPDAFLERTHRALMGPGEEPDSLAVTFVNVLGLAETREDPAKYVRIQDRVASALQEASVDGSSAARLTDERYALLRHADDHRDVADEVREAGLAEGVDLEVCGSDIDLPGTAAPVQVLRALRLAVESCLKDGGLERPDLAFTACLMKTLEEADQFRAMVRQRRFDLHFQPIVDLTNGEITHFEALARFDQWGGPAETLRMAEELALIEGFDLAVADKAVARLNRAGAGSLHLAVNVSGVSLAGDAYVQNLLRLTAMTPALRRRLIVEVTETATLGDPAAANLRLAALREAGIRVYIDDFGSGSAGFDYLRKLSVDAVKIDGSLITDFEADARSRQVISHIVDLCRSMSLKVVAERVETEACRLALVELGVDMGQGYLFGKPTAEPIQSRGPIAARRVGTVEGWG
ncbi:EAL domain-containing protein [Brevundimonas sp.]|uniref:EAL domain-containing protein n=1 Tax=Brevundimonas sp. TaxID=1871086 RepID=UPI0022C1A2BA|nr:EAL domain-containing protein [Brevundimonas sp.]MCZ8195238.1 EAL domain-containing protein [Brevundimonas sp.]